MVIEQKNGYTIRMRRGASNSGNSTRNVSASSGYGIFATPRNTRQLDYYAPRYYGEVDPKLRFDEYDRREVLQYSRELFAQLGDLSSAIVQKNYYAFGDSWKPLYTGRNEKWGEEATEWLKDVWYPQCSLRGPVFDFVTELFLSGVAYDVDGEDLMVMAVDESGFPRLKFYSAHQIGCRGNDKQVKGGWADGARIDDGIIFDRQGAVIGYRVLGCKVEEDQDFTTGQAQLLFEPEWRSWDRGVPRIGKCTLDAFDVQDIDKFLKRGVKLEQSIGLIHSTESGGADPGSDIITDQASGAEASDVKIERRFGGEILYLKAGAGEKIEGLQGQRPNPNTVAFLNRLMRRVFASVGWFYELVDPSGIGGASVRLIQDEARHSVANRQKTGRKRALRGVTFALAQAMETGRVSKNDDGVDFMRWHFNMPPQITVDQGYDEQAARDNLLLGLTTKAALCEKNGKWHEDVDRQRVKENSRLILNAVALVQVAKAQNQVLTLREAIDLMQQNTANGRPALLPGQDASGKPIQKEVPPAK
jgi:hypothetical protein